MRAFHDDGTGNVTLFGDRCVLAGVNVTESAGTAAAAHLRVRDGSVSGAVLATVKVAGDGHADVPVPHVHCQEGVFLERVTGSTEVVAYIE